MIARGTWRNAVGSGDFDMLRQDPLPGAIGLPFTPVAPAKTYYTYTGPWSVKLEVATEGGIITLP